MTNIILRIPNHKPSAVYPQIYKLVSDLDDKYVRLVTKWVFLHSGTLVEIPKYDGTLISYRNIRFDGSPELVFWQGLMDTSLNLRTHITRIFQITDTLLIQQDIIQLKNL